MRSCALQRGGAPGDGRGAGAHPWGTTAGETPEQPKIARYLLAAYPEPEEAAARLASFREVVGPFAEARAEWLAHITSGRWLTQHANYGRGGRYVTNAAGARLNVAGLEGWPLASKLASHLLTGLEVEFVFRLIALSRPYGYEPWSYQYDGLVVRGEIPDAAVTEALASSVLREVELRVKPFPRPEGGTEEAE